jgi:hypothetical protein
MSISHEQQIRQQLQAKGYRVLEVRTVEVDQRAGPIYQVSAEKADPPSEPAQVQDFYPEILQRIHDLP